MSHYNGPAASITPTQNTLYKHGRSLSNQGSGDAFSTKEGHPSQAARSLANTLAFGPRNASLAPSGPPPGSFSSDLKSIASSRLVTPGTPKADAGSLVGGDYFGREGALSSEQRQNQLREKINKETKIKIGSENLLEALVVKSSKQTRDQRQRVESELTLTNRKLSELNNLLDDEIERSKRPVTPTRDRLSGIFQNSPLKSPDDENPPQVSGTDDASVSPSYILDNLLQALEVESMQPDYYVERANSLCKLFKRFPSIKYDLAWSIFGLRVQSMLLSDNREVSAAGYRVTRHSIADKASLQKIRALNTDDLVILSLVKESKASMEREQALKFVRAFLDVKGGVNELSGAVLRTVVAVAEHHDDRLRNMALLTLAEVLLQSPSQALLAGAISPLADILQEGSYFGSESLASVFLQLEDRPQSRQHLLTGFELDGALTPFTDADTGNFNEARLKSNARLISAILKTWPGVFALSRNNFVAIRSLLKSLQINTAVARDLILDLIFDILHITPPTWTSSFLAGRRLTTYGRVANMKADSTELHFKAEVLEGESTRFNLVEHFTTLLLAIFLNCGLVEALNELCEYTDDTAIQRKAAVLLGEVLKLADHCLPNFASARIQALPSLFSQAIGENDDDEDSGVPSAMIYQIERVSRTMHKSSKAADNPANSQALAAGDRKPDQKKTLTGGISNARVSVDVDDLRFRSLIIDTQVLSSANHLKWRWDIILDLIEGPLTSQKRLEESIKASKFMKRLIGFYRPFKNKFSEIRNTKPNQRYVRVGCALMKTLIQHQEGVIYLVESKFFRQLAECLAQLDKQKGLTAIKPFFSKDSTADTLIGGYFAMLGTLSGDPKGLAVLERWRMINMLYHIVDLDSREDLVKILLSNLDFSLDSHIRVMLSKALTACPKNIRIFATGLLRKYAIATPTNNRPESRQPEGFQWAIRLLVTQLYDPEVQVSEVAVQILEEACNKTAQLEYVVCCRPALDHLGAIGAPLLLRFLSTSLGYKYLHGLDYITQEMDDWFLGRNDSYVTLVEASLSRALAFLPDRPKSNQDDQMNPQEYGTVPPHFYRELTRTVEGCKLLRESGHFEAFVRTIRKFWGENEDLETILKVKGCMWAVGNVGAMEFGAPFLEESDVVLWIVKIATHSQVMTMRGTAFFVLGLISRSLHGMEILADHGWTAATDHLGRSLGYCLPPSLDSLLVMEREQAVIGLRSNLPSGPRKRAKSSTDGDPVQARILATVVSLCNTVLTKKAAAELVSIKGRSPEPFNSIGLFRKVMGVLEKYHFRLQVRRFVIDLFDKGIMRRIVLEDDSGTETI